jgi:hypothetical protein
LREDFLAAHGLQTYLLQSSRFTEREDWSVGRQDSVHGVFFGELELTVDNGDTVNVPVAAKPYWRFLAGAVHEYAALEYCRQNPELSTFEPLGFWVTEGGEPVLLTKFEEAVTSLDNVDWRKNGMDPLHDHFDLFTALQKSAQILARLHINGLSHRDAQIKNMAVDTEQNAVRLVDLTTLEAVGGAPGQETTKWRQCVYDDLKTLVSSVRQRGFLAGDDTVDVRDSVQMALLGPHSSMLRHPSQAHRLDTDAIYGIDDINQQILDEV